jgi:hypothetical protein
MVSGLELKINMNHQAIDCEHELVPILYGYPIDAYREITSTGKAFLGGCIIPNIDPIPHSRCKKCFIDSAERVDLDW